MAYDSGVSHSDSTTPQPATPTALEQHVLKTTKARFKQLRGNIDITHADIPVCLCGMVSGLCDAVAFNACSVFVSMQTGNTIFLALGAAHLPKSQPELWAKSLCSIGSFMLGVFCFGQSRHFRPTSKLTLAGSFLIQSILIFIAAGLAQGQIVPAFRSLEAAEQATANRAQDLQSLGVIVLLAFQFGGQICTSRILGFNEVPTTVLTSVYCDLFNDPMILAPWRNNLKRNRRFAVVVLTLMGAVMSAWIAKSGADMSIALWIAGGIKFGISVAWLAWETKGSQDCSN